MSNIDDLLAGARGEKAPGAWGSIDDMLRRATPEQQAPAAMSPSDAALMSHAQMPDPELPELPLARTTLDNPHLARTAGGQLNLLRRSYPNAELDFDENGGTVFVLNDPQLPNPSQRFILNAKGPSLQDLALFEAESLKTVPAIAAGLATSGMGWLPAVTAVGVAGTGGSLAMQGAANFLGADEPYSPLAAVIDGGMMAAGEGAGRLFAKGIGATMRLFRRMTSGRVDISVYITQDGQLTQAGMREMVKRGISADDFSQMIRREIREGGDDVLRELDNLLPDQQARKTKFQAAGFTGESAPTMAQLTRSGDDFLTEQTLERQNIPELIKRKLAQNKQFQAEAARIAEKTGGTAIDDLGRGDSVVSALTTKDKVWNRAVNRAYAEARQNVGDNAPVEMGGFVSSLDDLTLDDVHGYVGRVQSWLKSRGVVNDKGEAARPMTLLEAEGLRKRMNHWFAPGQNNYAINAMKDQLDEAVFAAGGDVFDQARSLARARFSQLHTAEGAKKLVADMVAGKIPEERVLRRVVLNGTDKEIRFLKDALMTGSAAQRKRGEVAWNNLRRGLVEYVAREGAKNTALDEAGNVAWSSAGFKRAWARVPEPNKRLLLSSDEIKALDTLAEVGQLVQPPPRGVRGSTTADNMLRMLDRLLSKLPGGGVIKGMMQINQMGQQQFQVNAALNPQRVLSKQSQSMMTRGLIEAAQVPALNAALMSKQLFYPVTGAPQQNPRNR